MGKTPLTKFTSISARKELEAILEAHWFHLVATRTKLTSFVWTMWFNSTQSLIYWPDTWSPFNKGAIKTIWSCNQTIQQFCFWELKAIFILRAEGISFTQILTLKWAQQREDINMIMNFRPEKRECKWYRIQGSYDRALIFSFGFFEIAHRRLAERMRHFIVFTNGCGCYDYLL